MAPSAFMTPAATTSPSSIPGATGTPSPRIEPWTFQDTAARVSEAGPLHGCTCGPGPPPDPDYLTEGGHLQFQGDNPHPARVAGEVAPVPAGLRPRRLLSAKTRQMRRAPPLPACRMYLPPYSP